MSQSTHSNARSPFSARTALVLDASRGLAALVVVLQHARTSLLVPPESIVNPSAAIRALYWISGFGHQAVMVFFVLSGALVGGSVLRSVENDSWSWREYLIRRLARLYVVLLPALLLILVWDGLGAALFPTPAAYLDVMSSITVGSHTLLVHNRDLLAYLGNATFLMTVYVPVFGSGAALWSLSNEFWYYILFPCMILVVARRRNSLRSLAYLALLLAIFSLVSRTILEDMTIWLLGVAVVRAPRIRLTTRGATVMTSVALALFVGVTAAERTTVNVISLSGDCAIGAAFAIFLYCVCCRDAAGSRETASATSAARWAQLAGFSYTLYLFHQPPLAFIGAWLMYRHHALWQPTVSHITGMLVVTALVVIYAYAGSRVTESRTDELRGAVSAFFAKRRRANDWLRRRPPEIPDADVQPVTA